MVERSSPKREVASSSLVYPKGIWCSGSTVGLGPSNAGSIPAIPKCGMWRNGSVSDCDSAGASSILAIPLWRCRPTDKIPGF